MTGKRVTAVLVMVMILMAWPLAASAANYKFVLQAGSEKTVTVTPNKPFKSEICNQNDQEECVFETTYYYQGQQMGHGSQNLGPNGCNSGTTTGGVDKLKYKVTKGKVGFSITQED